ncbi:MAG: FHA domain-containing protein [Acidobacteria bacterium]|nr:FHA domain-containing protein [Acidobacteriota bacterium]
MGASYRAHFLRGLRGTVAGDTFVVGRWVLLGRGPEADIRLPDSTVSRVHAAIAWAEGSGFVLGDLGSATGVYVNGRRVEQARLEAGDRIRLGAVEFAFRPAPVSAGTLPGDRAVA